MPAISHLTAERFRGLRGVELAELGQVNRLVGRNNVGKSSLLEAVSIWCRPLELRHWYETVRLRTTWPFYDGPGTASASRMSQLDWLFSRDKEELPTLSLAGKGQHGLVRLVGTAQPIEGAANVVPEATESFTIEGTRGYRRRRTGLADGDDPPGEDISGGLEIILNLEWDVSEQNAKLAYPANHLFHVWDGGVSRIPERVSFPAINVGFVSTVSHRSEALAQFGTSEAIKKRRVTELLSLLRLVDPEIVGLQVLSDDRDATMSSLRRRPVLHLEHAQLGFIPIHAAGDGMRRVLHLATQLSALRGGVLLIDELEIGLHHAALVPVFRWLVDAARALDVQIFATTHSQEAIDAILADEGDLDQVAHFQISPGRARRLSGEMLRRLRYDRGLEVRG